LGKDLHLENCITLACTEEAWEQHLFSKGNFYYALSLYLHVCEVLVSGFPVSCDEDFPPSFEYIYKKLKENFPSRPSMLVPKRHKEFFIKAKLFDDFFIKPMDTDNIDDFLDNVHDFFSNGLDEISDIDIEDEISLENLAHLSLLMAGTFYSAPFFPDAKKHIFCIKRYDNLALHLVAKVYNTLGYWTAKMEEKKRNLKNVSVRTEKKMDNIKIIEKMLVESEFKVDRNFIREAMKNTDRYERTVKDMIKKVMEKKNK